MEREDQSPIAAILDRYDCTVKQGFPVPHGFEQNEYLDRIYSPYGFIGMAQFKEVSMEATPGCRGPHDTAGRRSTFCPGRCTRRSGFRG